jgi:Mg2+ and Co2+ transporter CorA
MHYIITYDKSGVRQQKQISQTDLENGYQIWLDLENPTLEEISNIQEIFAIDANILKQYSNGVKNHKYEF